MSISVHLLLLLLLVIGNYNDVRFFVYGVVDEYRRDDFPAEFVFGSGTSAYQVEGAVLEDGRTFSIWDTFAHSGNTSRNSDGRKNASCSIQFWFPPSLAVNHLEILGVSMRFGNGFVAALIYIALIRSKVSGYYSGANGDIACDGYHKYKEDIELMAKTGLEAYRFSISWSRLIPNGRGPVNVKGLQFYNDFINRLIAHGIQPHVTLHHDDLPQILEDEYGGWISRKSVKDYIAYAEVCFREFGDRVLHWTTINEANVYVLGGYDAGFMPPGHCSSPFGYINCSKGDSTSEPYLAAHHMLLAHASTVRLYRKKYKAMQHGFIGINVFSYWFEPFTNTTEDVKATQRANDFYLGWFLNPLVNGDYPEIMKKNAGNRIPSFTKIESEKVKGSFDFFGINHYTTLYVKDNPKSLEADTRDVIADMSATLIYTGISNGSLPSQFLVNPLGLQNLLNYVKEEYGNPPIYIHENGQQQPRNGTLMDTPRVEYLHAYIGALLDALRNGSNTIGYFVWSFFDLFELLDGYNSGFGLYYVDLDDKELTRYPKLSAHWYANFLKGNNISDIIISNLEVQDSFSSSH